MGKVDEFEEAVIIRPLNFMTDHTLAKELDLFQNKPVRSGEELVSAWEKAYNIHNYEMDEGIERLGKLIEVIGYEGLYDFLIDNPAMCEGIRDFIAEHTNRVVEWREAIESVLPVEEYEDEEE